MFTGCTGCQILVQNFRASCKILNTMYIFRGTGKSEGSPESFTTFNRKRQGKGADSGFFPTTFQSVINEKEGQGT